MLARLLNQHLQIISRSDSGEVDEWGNDVPSETVAAISGLVQQRSSTEPSTDVPQTQWFAILPAGTSIDRNDQIVAADVLYEVTGDPNRVFNPRTQSVSHIEVTLNYSGPVEGS